MPSVCGGRINMSVDVRTSLVDPVDELENNMAEAEGELQALSQTLAEVAEGCKTDRQIQWDPVSCINIGEDVSDGIMLSIRCAIFAVNISQQFEATTKHFLDCPDSNFFMILPCYSNSTMTFVEHIKDLKDGVTPFLTEAKEILDKVKQDFGKCIGFSTAISTHVLDQDGC